MKWLQAVDDPGVAFIVMQPTLMVENYVINLDATMWQTLKLEKEEELTVLAIVRVDDGKLIANLKGPLLFNSRLKIGIQAVLE